jgi:hypothetical protein
MVSATLAISNTVCRSPEDKRHSKKKCFPRTHYTQKLLPSTPETEAGGSQVQGQPELRPCPKKNRVVGIAQGACLASRKPWVRSSITAKTKKK